jgi:hypothetical protein
MSNDHPNLPALIFACIFFGYAIVNSLVFYRRARQARQYPSAAVTKFARSPRYATTVWISGLVGIIGFTIASWRLTIALWSMLHAPH